jgi:serine protease Do
MDLNLFQFDYDLTWAVFFLNADETIYGRFGGRDSTGADSRNTLAGLRYALTKALERHEATKDQKPTPRNQTIQKAEDYPAAKRLRRNDCIHCHQVKEFQRDLLQKSGKWDREEIWTYPLPENLGISLDKEQGDQIKSILPKSVAEKTGLLSGDVIQSLNGYSVASFADAQFALHQAPKSGEIPIRWTRKGKEMNGKLELSESWRKTNVTWRPSLLDILPSFPFSGDDLTPEEKKALGLNEKRVALQQDKFVHSTLKVIGLQAKDVIIGINDEIFEGNRKEFLGHIRKNFLVGDKITLNVLRNGKRFDLPMTLK